MQSLKLVYRTICTEWICCQLAKIIVSHVEAKHSWIALLNRSLWQQLIGDKMTCVDIFSSSLVAFLPPVGRAPVGTGTGPLSDTETGEYGGDCWHPDGQRTVCGWSRVGVALSGGAWLVRRGVAYRERRCRGWLIRRGVACQEGRGLSGAEVSSEVGMAYQRVF